VSRIKPRYGAVRNIEHTRNLARRLARVAAVDRLFLLVLGFFYSKVRKTTQFEAAVLA
jgi:hypothetical protein